MEVTVKGCVILRYAQDDTCPGSHFHVSHHADPPAQKKMKQTVVVDAHIDRAQGVMTIHGLIAEIVQIQRPQADVGIGHYGSDASVKALFHINDRVVLLFIEMKAKSDKS